MNYNVEQLTEILGIRETIIYNKNEKLKYITTDSRSFVYEPAATMFCAIQTISRDGHDFVENAYSRGIRFFLVEKILPSYLKLKEANFFIVNSVVDSLQSFAAYHRKRFNIPVIGITGSNGKTIVKDWIAFLLSHFAKIVKSPRSYNSQIGVPLSVFQMEEYHDFAVFEAGISEPGQMEKLYKIINPDIGVFTNIGAAHDEFFKNRKQKIKEKLLLFQTCRKLIVCSEMTEILEEALKSGFVAKKNLFLWGSNSDDDIQVIETICEKNKIKIFLKLNDNSYQLNIPFSDFFSYQNALQSFATLVVLGFEPEKLIPLMEALPTIAMRFEMIEGINNNQLINDTYNFDVESLVPALEYLQYNKYDRKSIVILSDVVQTGRNSEDLYSDIAHKLHIAKVDGLIGIGAGLFTYQKLFKNIPDSRFYPSTEAFLEQFDANLFRDSIILIKGARKFSFERIVHALEQKTHHTVLEVSLNNIAHNIRQFRKLLRPTTRLMVMVKAFSYGSGSFEIARFLELQGVDYLAVAFVDEGVMLRQKGIQMPIMVMAPEMNLMHKMLQYNLEPEIYSIEALRMLKKFKTEQIRIHLKLDTGMHRLGLNEDNLLEACNILQYLPNVHLVSVFSHLAEAENADNNRTQRQLSLFEQMMATIEKKLGFKPLKHILNTAGIINLTEFQFDMVRIGIGIYGIEPNEHSFLQLLPVLKLKTSIIQIKKVSKNEYIGYGNKFRADCDMKIAIIPIGYADGFSRKLGFGRGVVFVNNKPCKVVGAVCMDLTMIDVTEVEVKIGDEVIIFDDIAKLKNFAHLLETIPYEIITNISQRVKRQYIYE